MQPKAWLVRPPALWAGAHATLHRGCLFGLIQHDIIH